LLTMPDERDSSINVFVVDSNETPLRGAVVEIRDDGKLLGRATTRGFANTPVRLVIPPGMEAVTLRATYLQYSRDATVPASAGNCVFRFEEVAVPKKEVAGWEKVAAFAFGILFVVILLWVALFIPQPTDFQLWVFRVVLSLAAAGIGAVLPGIISVNAGPYVRAGGALALFVIVYWFNPPQLVSSKQNGSPVVAPTVTYATLLVVM
jgi:hypothetical protein